MQNKNTKRLISVLICLAMVLAVLPMAVVAVGTTLYCVAPENWTNCNVYAWVGATGENNSGWPGVPMQKGADGVWYAEVDATFDKVIFNNGSAQTADLDMPVDDKVQFNYAAKAWSTRGEELEPVETSYYLRGTMNNWAADANNVMTKNADGTYSFTISLGAGSYEYKAAVDDWSWAVPQDGNLILNLEEDDTVTFTLDVDAKKLTYTLASGTVVTVDYYLRGTMNNWAADASNVMTKNADGTYSITMDLVAGDYTYKAGTADWSWSCPGEDATLKVVSDCAVTFVLDVEANTLTATGSGVEEILPEPMNIESIVAVGGLPEDAEGELGNFLNGAAWDVTSTDNVAVNKNGVYSVVYTGVAAGTYEFKFAANGGWDISWGVGGTVESGVAADAWFNGGNCVLNVAEDNSTVTLALDLSNVNLIDGSGAKITATVSTSGPSDPDPSVPQPTDPTEAPTVKPNDPTKAPTEKPNDPTTAPTVKPNDPTKAPTEKPNDPTKAPTVKPNDPTKAPTVKPNDPTKAPTVKPNDPTVAPTVKPNDPTVAPTVKPNDPTVAPTVKPNDPTTAPTVKPETPSANYFVAGQAGLCGSEWKESDEANKMALNADGLYQKTYSDVPSGSYEFKVTDGTWDNCWGNPNAGGYGNYAITLDVVSDVIITFDAEAGVVSAEIVSAGEAPSDPEIPTEPEIPSEPEIPTEPDVPTNPSTPADPTVPGTEPSVTDPSVTEPAGDVPVDEYFVAGVAGLCGSDWKENDPANQMALNADGLYQKTYTGVAAGAYEFKITDGTWTNSWGQDGGQANYALTVDAECDLIITFNPETREISVEIVEKGSAPSDPEIPTPPATEAPTVPVTGDVSEFFVAGVSGLCGSEWKENDPANQMLKGSDGLCYKTFKNVPAGTYEFKVTKGNWDESWGVAGANVAFTLDKAEDVTIAFNPATGDIYVLRGDDTVPEFGDVSLTAVAVALLAATAGVVAIVKKKEF